MVDRTMLLELAERQRGGPLQKAIDDTIARIEACLPDRPKIKARVVVGPNGHEISRALAEEPR